MASLETSSRAYLARAKERLEEERPESLFYAALELRFGIEARLAEYRLGAIEFAKLQTSGGYKIEKRAREVEREFTTHGRIAEFSVLDSATGTVRATYLYTPVRKNLRNMGEKLGDLLHVESHARSSAPEWVAATRSFLNELVAELEVACTGTLLTPPLMDKRTGEPLFILRPEGGDEGLARLAALSPPGGPMYVRVAYHDELPGAPRAASADKDPWRDIPMIVRLMCGACAMRAQKAVRRATPEQHVEIPVPIAHLNPTSEYDVRCEKGHESKVVLDNVWFELMFELGLNYLADGKTYEAVCAVRGAWMKFEEFYWLVASTALGSSPELQQPEWDAIAQSPIEGSAAYSGIARRLGSPEPIMIPEQDRHFAERVWRREHHATLEEAIAYGDVVLTALRAGVEELRRHAADALLAMYTRISPATLFKNTHTTDFSVCNILTTVDVRHPPASDNPVRSGNVRSQFARILRDREPYGMELRKTRPRA